MANYKQIFLNYLDEKGVKYTDQDEHRLSISVSGKNHKNIVIHVNFDKEGDGIVRLCSWEIANFKDKFAAGIMACNEMNAQWRWVKFYIDEDMDVMCEMDARIDEATCASECFELTLRVYDIIDKAYPTFMKALWSE